MLEMFLPIAAFLSLCILMLYGLMYLISRFLSPRSAVVPGALAAGYVLYTIINQVLICRRPPVYHPPTDSGDDMGHYEYACDSAGGVLAYTYINIIGPLTFLALLAVTAHIWVYWRPRHRARA